VQIHGAPLSPPPGKPDEPWARHRGDQAAGDAADELVGCSPEEFAYALAAAQQGDPVLWERIQARRTAAAIKTAPRSPVGSSPPRLQGKELLDAMAERTRA
jgi:hypothetical protein